MTNDDPGKTFSSTCFIDIKNKELRTIILVKPSLSICVISTGKGLDQTSENGSPEMVFLLTCLSGLP